MSLQTVGRCEVWPVHCCDSTDLHVTLPLEGVITYYSVHSMLLVRWFRPLYVVVTSIYSAAVCTKEFFWGCITQNLKAGGMCSVNTFPGSVL